MVSILWSNFVCYICPFFAVYFTGNISGSIIKTKIWCLIDDFQIWNSSHFYWHPVKVIVCEIKMWECVLQMKTTTFTTGSFMRRGASSLEKRAFWFSLNVRGRCLPQPCLRLKARLHRNMDRQKVNHQVKSNTDSDEESEILPMHKIVDLNRRCQKKCAFASAMPDSRWG